LKKSRRPVGGAAVFAPFILHLDATPLENVPAKGKRQETLMEHPFWESQRL
jgi:hypothetical protein